MLVAVVIEYRPAGLTVGVRDFGDALGADLVANIATRVASSLGAIESARPRNRTSDSGTNTGERPDPQGRPEVAGSPRA